MKLPALQFYPADWKKDPGVQALSFHDRGVWLEILCLMHESERRGVLLLGSQPMPEDALARLLGLDNQILTTTLTTLLTYGVASREEGTGALMNRRMVRDEHIRQVRKKAGELGGNPNLLNQTSKQKRTTKVNQIPTPSSSSSISSSEDSPLIPYGDERDLIPKNAKRLNKTEQKRIKATGCSDRMNAIGAIYGKPPGSPWTVYDVKALLQVDPSMAEIQGISEFYASTPSWIRQTIPVLLNNWNAELDRARAFINSRP